MSKMSNHLKWCLNEEKRLKKIKPDIEIAKLHIKKSEYNHNVVKELEKLKIYDWGLNVAFYSIYHCLLAIISKYGYESRNQSCTVSTILNLIDEKKIDLDRNLILQFDTFETETGLTNPTIRKSRENSTYGVKTTININELEKIKKLVLIIQRETIRIVMD